MHRARVIVSILHCWRRVDLRRRSMRLVLSVSIARAHAANTRASAAVRRIGVVRIVLIWIVRHGGCSVTRSPSSTIRRGVEFGLVIAHAHRRIVALLVDRSGGERGLVWIDVGDGSATAQVLVTRQHAIEVVVLQGRNGNKGADAPENAVERILVSLPYAPEEEVRMFGFKLTSRKHPGPQWPCSRYRPSCSRRPYCMQLAWQKPRAR